MRSGGDAFGSGGRWQTCIRLSGDIRVLLVDCGPASRTALRSQGASAAEVVTHLRGDHFGGLPVLVEDGQSAIGRTGLATLRAIGQSRIVTARAAQRAPPPIMARKMSP